MKQYLFFVIFCMTCISVEAQDYLPVPEGRKMYFRTEYFSLLDWNDCYSNDCVLGMSVDSLSIGVDTTKYFFYKMLRHSWSGLCEGDSWLGRMVSIDGEGNQHYSNNEGSVILIKPFEVIDSTWSFYQFEDSTFLEAKITERFEEEIVGTMDSVIRIEFQLKNQTGGDLDHSLNGDQILLSSNNGFIEVFDFYSFPEDTIVKALIGFQDTTSHGIVPPSAGEVFDFEVGDIYQRNFSYDGGFSFTHIDRFTSDSIMSKTTSSNGDTIIYQVFYQFYQEFFDIDTPWEITHGSDTVYRYFILSEYAHFSNLPMELKVTDDDPFNYEGYVYFEIIDDEVLIVENKNYYPSYDYDECLEEIVGTGIFETNKYKGCLGLYESYGEFDYTNYVYYKKGSEEWGTPIDFDALTPVREPLLPEQSFTVFPNPADDYLNITSDEFQNEDIEIIIYSLDGRILLKQTVFFAGSLQLQFQNQITGLAVLKILTSKGQYISKVNFQ